MTSLPRIAPSILSADFAALGDAVALIEGGADLLHVDVMDGHFVPNLTIGPPVIKALRARSELYFDCHLMMTNPGDYLEMFKNAGADGCSVHVEVGQTAELLAQMRDLGLDVGLVINPDTAFEHYVEFLDRIDLLVLMTVHPGFGGQAFIADVMPKLRRTADEIQRRSLHVAIEVDGGIDVHTAPVAAEYGADTFVAGSAVFGRENPAEAIAELRAVIATAKDKG